MIRLRFRWDVCMNNKKIESTVYLNTADTFSHNQFFFFLHKQKCFPLWFWWRERIGLTLYLGLFHKILKLKKVVFHFVSLILHWFSCDRYVGGLTLLALLSLIMDAFRIGYFVGYQSCVSAVIVVYPIIHAVHTISQVGECIMLYC